MMRTGLEMFVVYDHPRDFPNDFVVRRWTVGVADTAVPDPACWTRGHSLDEVRQAIPSYCVRLERDPHDEPQIVEVWI